MSRVILTPEQQIRQRYGWFEEAKRLGNVTVACRRLGISRETFYKWRHRFAASRGARQALLARSRRPRRKVKKALRRRLVAVRQRTHLGPGRLRAPWLARGVRHVPSAMTIAKVPQQVGLTRRPRPRP